MRIQSIFLFFTIITLASSCEKEIPLKQEEIKSRIVVNSIFSTEDTFRVHLSESRNALYEGQLPAIETASASLSDGSGNLIGEFQYEENGNYILPGFVPLAGSDYTLNVSYSDFNPVSSNSSAPSVILLSSIDTTSALPTDKIRFDLSFEDNVNEENFYSISIVKYSSYVDPQTGDTYYYESPYFSTNENYVENGQADLDNEKYAEEFFFSDKLINGQTVSFSGTHYLSDFEQPVFYIRLNSLSEDLYKYKISYSKYANTQGNVFAEPVQVYSNIEDGFGVFGGYSTYLDSVVVQ